MKQGLLTILVAGVSAAGFGQGKVNLINDAASLIVLHTDTGLLNPADVGLAGQAVGNLTPLPSGAALLAGLYAGTSSSTLFLYSTVTLTDQGTPGGYIPGTHMVLNANAATGAPAIPGIANGTAIAAATPWLQVRVWDARFPSYEAAQAVGHNYSGVGPEFQFNPGPSLSYPNTAPAGVNSTWTDGNIVLVWPIPEPSGLALVGLGAASLAVLRRLK